MREWYERLGRRFTVVRYDHRGGGMSTRRDGVVRSIDALVDDIGTIADEVSPEPFVLLGFITGGLPAIAYAARHPERVSHLVLWCSGARHLAQGNASRVGSLFQLAASDWELFTESLCQAALGWREADEARSWAAVVRQGTTQAEFLRFVEERRQWDVTAELENVRAPTLVLHDESNALTDSESGRELAARIADARFVACSTARGAPDSGAIAAIDALTGSGARDGTDLGELTPREVEVLGLVAEGATNAEVAERLFISVNTVTRHLTHIYAKTGMKHRTQAVRYALERGLGRS